MLMINKFGIMIVLLMALWFLGFWMGRGCYIPGGSCYATEVKKAFDEDIR